MSTDNGAAGRPALVADVDALVARYVSPGSHLHLAMTMARPNAMVYALARQFGGRGDFTISTSATHTSLHALTMSGAIRHLITCFLGDTYPTPRPNPLYRDLARDIPFTCELWSLLSFTQRLMAGAMGLPYTVTASLVGSDLEKGKGRSFVRLPDPAGTDRPFGLVESLRPDLTLVHGACADRRGNIILVPPAGEGAWGAYAAEKGVLASVERIVPDEFVDARPEQVVIPGQRVIALCEAPLGAHPQSLRGLATGEVTGYRDDYTFLTEMVECLATEEGAKEWFRDWVEEPAGHAEYVARLGTARREELKLAEQPLAPRNMTSPVEQPRPPFHTGTPARTRPLPRDPVTRQERTIILGARAIAERVTQGRYDTLLAGIGVSHLAAWLSAGMLRRRGIEVPVCAELGFYGTDPEPGDVFLFSQLHATRSQLLAGIPEILGGMVSANRRCLGVLAAGEIDARGNINTSLLADGRWLTGSGGANDIASSTDCLVLSTASRRKFVPRVAYVTSPGERVREVAGHFGRFSRDSVDEPFRLTTWLPLDDGPTTPGEAVASLTGWPVHTEGWLPEPAITDEEIAWLRGLDPQGFYR
ncbi:CoA-transferase [Streptomyces sp. GTA36]